MKKSLLELDVLVSAVGGKVIGSATECYFEKVATDSRNVTENTLFVPLVGEFQNGHKYVPQAIENGASVVFINESEYLENSEVYENLAAKNKAVLICVENTLHALQDCAEAYVAKFPQLTKISITGSSGKTTTKEMTVAVMRQYFGEENIVYTKGNFNSETGLPLSVFQIKGTEKVGIFEMGMNRENEIGEISKVLKSKYGIITNIGTAHIGILGSRENIAKEKRKSFDYIPADGAVFVPALDDFADYCTETVKGKVVKYGKTVSEAESGVKFLKDNGLFGTCFSVDGVEVNLSLSGEYNYQNALGVIALAKELKIPAEDIKKGLESLSAVSGRMEVRKTQTVNNKAVTLIIDCYNANPDSMGKVIDFCGNITDQQKIFVLGDMKELGDASVKEHEKIGKTILSVAPDFVYLVGPDMEAAYNLIKNDGSFENTVQYFNDKSEEAFAAITENILENAKENAVVLLKGSHSMSLEKLIPMIEKKQEEKSGK